MAAFELGLISLYLIVVVAIAIFVGRGQKTDRDYYLADGSLPWWASGMSVMATQTSAISFISIPAFVALKPDGGLRFIQYEFALPLAMLIAMVVIFPPLRRAGVISIYAFLEQRFDRSVRRLLSAIFLLSRGLATGVMVYATGIILGVITGLPFWATLLIIGAGAIVQDMAGGIKAVVYTDVIQLIVLVCGLMASIWVGIDMLGGWSTVQQTVAAERWITITPDSGLGDGSSTPLWGFLIGGLFLYVSYYATDQSQAQRILAAGSAERMRHALLLNGLARFPLTLLYLILGLVLGALVISTPELADKVPADKLDALVPAFVTGHLPQGIRILLIAALLSAAMSSLDSALNALSASTARDFLESEHRTLSITQNRMVTFAWGVAVTGFAFIVGGIADTVIEAINKIGSAFYGPVLAAFITGILIPRVSAMGIKTGVGAGVASNLVLWQLAPGVNWMWWNLSGFLVAVVVAVLLFNRPADDRHDQTAHWLSQEWRHSRNSIVILLTCFVSIIFISCKLPAWLGP